MLLKYIPHTASYSVALEVYCSVSDKTEHVITCDVSIKHVKTEGSLHYVEVKKRNTIADGQEINDAYNDILLITAEALDTIVYKVDNSGRITGIDNYPDILSKWVDIRKKVELTYSGNEVESLLDGMQEILQSQDRLWKALQIDYFNTVFFNGLYGDYGINNYRKDEKVIYDLLPEDGIPVNIGKTLRDDHNRIFVSLNASELVSDYSPKVREYFSEETDVLVELQDGICTVDGLYTLDRRDCSIMTAWMLSEVSIEGVYLKRMNLRIYKK
jgi:hypothetical protein